MTQVQPLFASTREYCRAYLTDHEPDFYVEVTKEVLSFEQNMFELEAIEEGLKIRKFTDPFLERANIQRKIATELIKHNTVLLHGSTVAVDGNAYLFTAPCGTGKSTHTRLWREVFGSRAVMVNDDKTFLKISDAGVIAYGSPWSGKHGLETNVALPLKGICFLARGHENIIARASNTECMPELIHQCFLPEGGEEQQIVFHLLEKLARTVPLWNLDCTKESDAAIISYEAMSCV